MKQVLDVHTFTSIIVCNSSLEGHMYGRVPHVPWCVTDLVLWPNLSLLMSHSTSYSSVVAVVAS